jgi:hypothetical protein
MISIWFFIGILLIAYGALTLGAGLYELVSPPTQTTVLAELHAGVWWGAFIFLLGLFYTWQFRPNRTS